MLTKNVLWLIILGVFFDFKDSFQQKTEQKNTNETSNYSNMRANQLIAPMKFHTLHKNVHTHIAHSYVRICKQSTKKLKTRLCIN